MKLAEIIASLNCLGFGGKNIVSPDLMFQKTEDVE